MNYCACLYFYLSHLSHSLSTKSHAFVSVLVCMYVVIIYERVSKSKAAAAILSNLRFHAACSVKKSLFYVRSQVGHIFNGKELAVAK